MCLLPGVTDGPGLEVVGMEEATEEVLVKQPIIAKWQKNSTHSVCSNFIKQLQYDNVAPIKIRQTDISVPLIVHCQSYLGICYQEVCQYFLHVVRDGAGSKWPPLRKV